MYWHKTQPRDTSPMIDVWCGLGPVKSPNPRGPNNHFVSVLGAVRQGSRTSQVDLRPCRRLQPPFESTGLSLKSRHVTDVLCSGALWGTLSLYNPPILLKPLLGFQKMLIHTSSRLFPLNNYNYIDIINRTRRYCFITSGLPNLLSLSKRVLRPSTFKS